MIDRYQVVTPTNWNASPMDDLGQLGPIEQALKGTPVADLNQPIEILRVVHSFDPCLACSVHILRPGTVLQFTADDLVRPDGGGMSLHELGLGEALTMTRQLGCEPKDVVVFGIKPKDIRWGLELSEEITASVPKVVELVLAEIIKWICWVAYQR